MCFRLKDGESYILSVRAVSDRTGVRASPHPLLFPGAWGEPLSGEGILEADSALFHLSLCLSQGSLISSK